MATRFYFPNTTSELTPAFSGGTAGWLYTGEASRYTLATGRTDTPFESGTIIGPWSSSTTNKALDRQYILGGAGLAAQTINGLWSGQLQVQEVTSTDNVTGVLSCIRVVNSSGTAYRGTLAILKDWGLTGGGAEFSPTILRNKAFAINSGLTSLAVQHGDRLVVELGYYATSATTPEAFARYGDPSDPSIADLPARNNSDTDVRVPWIQFASDLTFASTSTKFQSGVSKIIPPSSSVESYQFCVARILTSIYDNIAAIGRISQSNVNYQAALSRLSKSNTYNQTAVSRIFTGATNKTQTGLARIFKSIPNSQSSLARISCVKTTTQTGLSRVVFSKTYIQVGVARILSSSLRTQTGLGRLAISHSYTQSGVAVISRSNNYTQTGIAKILVAGQSAYTQNGLARLRNFYARQQTGVSKILVIELKTETQTGISRLRKTQVSQQLGLAKLLVVSQNAYIQVGLAQISKSNSYLQLGIASLLPAPVLVSVIQTGLARLHSQIQRLQTALASINTGSKAYIQVGLARIQVIRAGSAPVHKSTGTSSFNNGGANPTPGLPGGVITGDILFLQVAVGNNAATCSVDGYTPIDSVLGASIRCFWFWKRATESESAPVITITGNSGASGAQCFAFSGCIQTGTPYEDATTAGETLSNAPSSTEVTSTGENRTVICSSLIEDDTAVSGAPPTGWTVIDNQSSALGTDLRLLLESYNTTLDTNESAGATQQATVSTSEYWGSLTLALIPENIFLLSYSIYGLAYILPLGKMTKIKIEGAFVNKITKVKVGGTFTSSVINIIG